MAEGIVQDVRIAVRTLARRPGFASAVVLTLGLGIGATTAVFSVVDGVLLRPAPVRDIDRLAVMWETDRHAGTIREPSAVPDYFDFQARGRQFEQLAAFTSAEVSLTPDRGDPSRLAALAVSDRFLPTLGITPIVGRTFTADEDQPGAPRVVLISEALWAQVFERDPAVEGRTLRLNDVPHTVVGVLPDAADFGATEILSAAAYGRGFAERGGRVRVDLWLPLQPSPSASRDNHPIIVVGRLRPDTTVAQAQEEMAAITADLERSYASNRARGAFVEPLDQVVFGPVRPALAALLGAVALVLLTACANVASLLLARGVARTHEVSVRAALGASRWHLTRQFLTESALLAAGGAVLGLALAAWGLDGLLALAPGTIPRIASVAISPSVLAVTMTLTLLAALAFGLVPLLQVRRADLRSALQGTSRHSSGRQHGRMRSLLVVAQLALAVMLLAGSGLLIRSLWVLQGVDPGFRTSGILKAEFQLPASRYPQSFQNWPNWTEAQRFVGDLRARVAALPGVQAATIAGDQPLAAGFTSSIRVEGREAEGANWPEPSIRRVDDAYFETMAVPVLAGRRFNASDGTGANPVIILNLAARRRFFNDDDPLGHRILLWGQARTVVGVVGDERIHGIAEAPPPAVYLPVAQTPIAGGSVLIRSALPASSLVPALRGVVRALDPGLPLFGVEELDDTLASSLGQRRFTLIVLAVFAVVAVLLAAIGVHGVLAYTMAQRTREMGIRLALGAEPRTVGRLVLRQGMVLAAVGVGVGLAGALALSRGLTSLLFGVSAGDPATYAGVALVLGSVALLASWLPARRAARVDPLEALRTE